MATLTEFCKIEAKLRFTPVGATGTGFRVDVPFEGTATSSHWEGERKVAGTDVVRIGSDGVQQLEIRARIGEGGDMVAYQAIGRGTDAPVRRNCWSLRQRTKTWHFSIRRSPSLSAAWTATSSA